MKGRFFVDTNVLVYADDADAGSKTARGRHVLREALTSGRGVLSTQVLQEYFVIATRKLGVEAAVARRKVELLARMSVVEIDLGLILGAIDLHRLHGISFWDALIVRSAAAAGCQRLLTEDLQDGQILDGVRIENPFAA
ncbi:MAG: PIN domain-containing protein [Deltaproteobacteria bacterium]|nr:PIN domain-containing protein [Deltaproteobacteria bacterium]MBW2530256.1 PIN domain-containing protein [Deltaproteobacteria bacterium]